MLKPCRARISDELTSLFQGSSANTFNTKWRPASSPGTVTEQRPCLIGFEAPVHILYKKNLRDVHRPVGNTSMQP